MQTDLPKNYYLDNVIILFDHVESVYGDILEAEYLNFLKSFRSLPEDGKRLYIRLLNRSQEWFRLSKLDYPEIADLGLAIKKLQQSALLNIDRDLAFATIIGLFNKHELLALHAQGKELKTLKRDALDQYLIEHADDDFVDQLSASDHFIKVEQKHIYVLFQMLFFGNLNQSMTDFVLRDLGLYQFEKYTINTDHRAFASNAEIEMYWLLHQIEQLTDIDDLESLIACFETITENPNTASACFRKSERIKFNITRQIERLGHLDSALPLYQQCRLPPARERIARIHHQQNNTNLALDICTQILAAPIDDSEAQFATEFSNRLARRSLKKYQPNIVDLQLERQHSVEHAVMNYYLENTDCRACYFLENSLFNSVLGLLIWDIIFEPVAGAFFNPFQHRPCDFFAHDFITKRQSVFERTWLAINSIDDIWQIAQLRWRQKHDLMNPLVDWNSINLEIIELALQRINYKHWMAIFERILRDLRNNRSGFPDLILFPADAGYRLIEVKGPGDRLQNNQQRWMAFFAEHDIPHALARVSWNLAQ
ncbi:MAG: VRR-NUC domain-containing protein [Gammaproteobacteria bacterium]|nr:VRR-NUC domain-containing protein [Gammaproteobacteria bacterium]